MRPKNNALFFDVVIYLLLLICVTGCALKVDPLKPETPTPVFCIDSNPIVEKKFLIGFVEPTDFLLEKLRLGLQDSGYTVSTSKENCDVIITPTFVFSERAVPVVSSITDMDISLELKSKLGEVRLGSVNLTGGVRRLTTMWGIPAGRYPDSPLILTFNYLYAFSPKGTTYKMMISIANEITKSDCIANYRKLQASIEKQVMAKTTALPKNNAEPQPHSTSKKSNQANLTTRLRGVAVYPFAGKGGADPSLAEAVSGLFANSISTGNGLRLVGSEIIADLAKQAGMEAACGSQTCQVDLAAQAKADFLVRGDLLRLQEDYFITTQVIDLHTKETIFADRIKTTKDQIVEQTEALAQQVKRSIEQY